MSERQVTAPITDLVFKDDFVKTFKSILDFVHKINQRNLVDSEALHSSIASLRNQLQAEISSTNADTKSKTVLSLTNRMARMAAEHEAKMAAIDQKISEVKDGTDGQDADEAKVAAAVLSQIHVPTLQEIGNTLPSLGKPIRDALELLQETERIDVSAIKGTVGIHVGPTPPEDTSMLWAQTT